MKKFQKVQTLKPKNLAARALRAGQFKPQRVPDKKKAHVKARTLPIPTDD